MPFDSKHVDQVLNKLKEVKKVKNYANGTIQQQYEELLMTNEIILIGLVFIKEEGDLKTNIVQDIKYFVNKVNSCIPNIYKKYQKQAIDLITLAYDILWQFDNQLIHLLQDYEYKEMKIATLITLAFIYKMQSKNVNCLKSLTQVQQVEDRYYKEIDTDLQKYVPSLLYLKGCLQLATVHSEEKRHQDALQLLEKVLDSLNDFEQHHAEEIKNNEKFRNKFLKYQMLTIYNMGVEKEHMQNFTESVKYYKQSFALSEKINDSFMTSKIEMNLYTINSLLNK